jgi:hypothetical protein
MFLPELNGELEETPQVSELKYTLMITVDVMSSTNYDPLRYPHPSSSLSRLLPPSSLSLCFPSSLLPHLVSLFLPSSLLSHLSPSSSLPPPLLPPPCPSSPLPPVPIPFSTCFSEDLDGLDRHSKILIDDLLENYLTDSDCNVCTHARAGNLRKKYQKLKIYYFFYYFFLNFFGPFF